jgi:hypothetical protein
VNGESAISPSSLPLLEETGNHRGKTVLIVFNRMRPEYNQSFMALLPIEWVKTPKNLVKLAL